MALQVAQELISATEVAIDNQRVKLGSGELCLRSLRMRFDIAFNLKATEDTFQNTDFLPVRETTIDESPMPVLYAPAVTAP